MNGYIKYIKGVLIILIISFCSISFYGVYAISNEECGLIEPIGTYHKVNGVCILKCDVLGLSCTTVLEVVTTFMQWLLYIFGFLAIISYVVSGILYMTSLGNETWVERAKNGTLWTTVGVIVSLSALIIVNALDNWLRGSSIF